MNKAYILSISIKFILVFIGITLLAELGVRLFVTAPSNHIFDPEIGFRYRPYTELFLATEGFARNKVNALGINDDEYDPNKRLKKAIVIGDSYTEARQVDRQANFTSLAEQNLAAWDIINAGRDGLHILNTYEVAKRITKTVQADLIVLVMSNGDFIDDLSNSNIHLTLKGNELIDVGIKAEQKEHLKGYAEWLTQHSALAVQLIRQFKPIIVDTYINILAAFNHKRNEDANLENQALSSARHIVEKKEILDVLLTKLRAIAPVAILYINQIEYNSPNDAYPAKKPADTAAQMQEIAAKRKISFINTANYLIKQYYKNRQSPFGFMNNHILGGHLNENGHQAVALALSDLIRQVEQGENN